MAEIVLKNIVKRFGDLVAVNDLSLNISDKEFLVLLDPSGCGKTTTLRCISGLGTPNEIYNLPKNVFVAKFVGSPVINLLNAAIEGNTLIIGKKAMVCSIFEKQCSLLKSYNKRNLIIGIRPEDVEISREKQEVNSFKCTVYFKQSMGVEDILNLKVDNIVFRAVTPVKIMTKIGETVYANVNMNRSHLFDPETENRIGEEEKILNN